MTFKEAGAGSGPHEEARKKLEQAVTAELDRLHKEGGFPGRTLTKRRYTIRKLAHCIVSPDKSKNDAFSMEGVVSQSTWYNARKDWGHNALMEEVLENVITLLREYEEGKGLREEEAEREEWRGRARTVTSKMLDKAEAMLNYPLVREEVIEVDEDGREVAVVMEPGNWSMGNVPQIVTAADKVGRLARGMDTDRTRTAVSLDWRDNLPPGASLEDLEAAKADLSKALAERALERKREEALGPVITINRGVDTSTDIEEGEG